MTKFEYKEPEFNVVKTSAEDVLTISYEFTGFESGAEPIFGV